MGLASMFCKELLEHRRNPRGTFLKLLFPLLLASPLLLGSPSPGVVSGALSLALLMTGVFGCGVGLARDKGSGIMGRLLVTPLSPRGMLMGHVAANVLLQAIQFAPVVFWLVLRQQVGPAAGLQLGVLFLLVMAWANSLGALLSSLATGPGEIHLYAALALFPVAALSGIFRPAGGGHLLSAVAGGIPLSHLNRALLQLMGGNAGGLSWAVVARALAATVALCVVTWAVAPRVLGEGRI